MKANVTPEGRTAVQAAARRRPAVTLMNSFVVPEGRDEAFVELWTATSEYFRRQPGFLSLRLHRAVTPEAPYRYVNVARWASDAAYRAARHGRVPRARHPGGLARVSELARPLRGRPRRR